MNQLTFKRILESGVGVEINGKIKVTFRDFYVMLEDTQNTNLKLESVVEHLSITSCGSRGVHPGCLLLISARKKAEIIDAINKRVSGVEKSLQNIAENLSVSW